MNTNRNMLKSSLQAIKHLANEFVLAELKINRVNFLPLTN